MPHNNCNLHHISNTLKNPTPCCSSLTFLPEPLLKALHSIKKEPPPFPLLIFLVQQQARNTVVINNNGILIHFS
jgi:hypothetical protein